MVAEQGHTAAEQAMPFHWIAFAFAVQVPSVPFVPFFGVAGCFAN